MDQRRPTEHLFLGMEPSVKEQPSVQKENRETVDAGKNNPDRTFSVDEMSTVPQFDRKKGTGTVHLGIEVQTQSGIDFHFPDQDSHSKNSLFLPRGTTLNNGRYKIEESIDKGGFGLVYRAHDATLDMTVAIKELFPSATVTRIPGQKNVTLMDERKKSEYQYLLDRYMLEARTMAKFSNHPNIVSIIDSFLENQTAYIVMEYLDGGDLNEYIKKNSIDSEKPRLSLEETVDITSKVLVGLNAIHRKKIIHRDIKPENIRITSDRRVKIMDFGAARFSPDEKDVITPYSNIVTVGFAPPEQYRSNSRQSTYTDLYAVGALFRYMLTGDTPVESTEREGEKVDPLRPLSEVCDFEIPKYIDKAITRVMDTNGGLRIQTANKLRWALQGKTKVRTWQEEKRISKIVKISAASLTIVLMGLLAYGVSYYSTAQKNGANIDAMLASSESISVYIPYNEVSYSDNQSKSKTAWDSLDSAFETYLSNATEKKIKLEKSFISESQYTSAIQNVNTNESPTIYTVETGTNNQDNLKIVKRLTSPQNYLFYHSVFDEKSETVNYFYCFDAVVMYVNTKLLRDTDITVDSLNSIEAINSTFSRIESDDEWKAISVCEKEASSYPGIDSESALADFCNGKVLCYIGLASEIHRVSEKLPGTFDVVAAPVADNRIHIYPQYFCVNSNASDNQKSAAQIFLAYMLSEEAQDIMLLQQESLLPTNPNIISQYVQYNPKLSFIFDDPELFQIMK